MKVKIEQEGFLKVRRKSIFLSIVRNESFMASKNIQESPIDDASGESNKLGKSTWVMTATSVGENLR